jgi:hypothetical protein
MTQTYDARRLPSEAFSEGGPAPEVAPTNIIQALEAQRVFRVEDEHKARAFERHVKSGSGQAFANNLG